MKVVAHIVTVVVALGLLLGVPAWRSVDFGALLAGGVDALSSATTIQDAPSGKYTILINRARHTDEETLAEWETFFSGGAVGLIMEDVDCTALASDAAGLEMATSLQSRLPENQMKLHVEEPVLALSKAENGLFDILVMSDEAAAQYDSSALEAASDVAVVHR